MNDEQLEIEDDSDIAITSEPHSLSAVPDLNRVFTIKGIRLYTDLFQRFDFFSFSIFQFQNKELILLK